MEPFLICLPVIRADVVATAVPLSATKSASIATAIAGDMRPSTFRKTDPPSVGVSHASLRRPPDRASDRADCLLLRPQHRAPSAFSGGRHTDAAGPRMNGQALAHGRGARPDLVLMSIEWSAVSYGGRTLERVSSERIAHQATIALCDRLTARCRRIRHCSVASMRDTGAAPAQVARRVAVGRLPAVRVTLVIVAWTPGGQDELSGALVIIDRADDGTGLQDHF